MAFGHILPLGRGQGSPLQPAVLYMSSLVNETIIHF